MRRTKRDPLRLMALEAREVPAAIVAFAGGNLTVKTDNVVNNVALTQLASGQIQVVNNNVTLGTFTASGNINVTSGNSSDSVRIALLPGTGIAGNISVNTGNGNDSIDLAGDTHGHVALNTGLGNDQVSSTGAAVVIGGNLTWTDITGANVFNMNDRDYTVNGNFILNGIGTFQMAGGTGTNTLSVVGTTIFNNVQTPTTAVNALFNGATANFVGTLQVLGGQANDVVTMTATINAASNVNLNLGGGTNSFTFNPAVGSAGIGGDLAYFGGVGGDAIVLGANSTIDGRTNLSLGNGVNSFVDTVTSVYAGNLTIAAGNGTTTETINGAINGNLDVSHGNGSGNSTIFTGALAGGFRYRGGNGPLTVLSLLPTAVTQINATISFGAGSATLNLGANLTLNGVVRGTSGANYTFNQGTAVLGPHFTSIFFP